MLVVLLLLVCCQAWAQARITSYDSQIVVNPDASLTVTETIDVFANHDQINHGIYRDFPTKYPGGFGKVVTVGFKVIKILRDGQAEPYSIAKRQNGKRIYIGDPNAYVDAGAHEYTIVYQTTRQLGFFEDRDDLY